MKFEHVWQEKCGVHSFRGHASYTKRVEIKESLYNVHLGQIVWHSVNFLPLHLIINLNLVKNGSPIRKSVQYCTTSPGIKTSGKYMKKRTGTQNVDPLASSFLSTNKGDHFWKYVTVNHDSGFPFSSFFFPSYFFCPSLARSPYPLSSFSLYLSVTLLSAYCKTKSWNLSTCPSCDVATELESASAIESTMTSLLQIKNWVAWGKTAWQFPNWPLADKNFETMKDRFLQSWKYMV
jgi:hypothetical protein